MTLTYPVEFYDATWISGRMRRIGTVPVLFPAYVSKKSSTKYGFKHLNSKTHLLDCNLYRSQNTAIIATTCKEYAFNFLLFPDCKDRDMLDYLVEHQGWKSDIRPAIQHSLNFSNSRKDLALKLYEWEHISLENQKISFARAKSIIHNELHNHQVRSDYTIHDTIKRDDAQNRIGSCFIAKRAGLIGRAFNFEIHLRSRPLLFTVLHEIAHVLDYHLYRANNHGPTFMHLYAELLGRYFNTDFVSKMTQAGLLQGDL